MNEEWRAVVGYEGLYEVSSLGRIRRVGRASGAIVGACLAISLRSGYPKVALSRNAKLKTFDVHRIVARAFLDGEGQGLEVNHLDGNKGNNRVENLEWTTSSGNKKHAARMGLINFVPGENHPNAKLTIASVQEIRESHGTEVQLAAQYGVSRSLIGAVRRRVIWNHI